MKLLVLYYSHSGNTRKTAELILQETGGDIAEIELTKPYTGSYQSVVDQGKREVERGFMPSIRPLAVDIRDYDTIVIGSPVWWYTFAPAVRTFLSEANMSGKRIYYFATNGGWIGHTFKDFEKAAGVQSELSGLNVRFDEDNMITPFDEIKKWTQSIL